MKAEPLFQPCNAVPLDRILNSVVIVNWETLGLGSGVAGVQIQYQTGMEGSVESLKLWARCGEYLSLICDFTPRFGWSDGPRFANGYHSRQLGRLLQAILLNQNLFGPECGPNAHGSLDIGVPTSQDITDATVEVSEAFAVYGNSLGQSQKSQ
jgi:hypothetical protein